MKLLTWLWCHRYWEHVGTETVVFCGRTVMICDHCNRPFLAGVAAR
jgi:hypothetical protein